MKALRILAVVVILIVVVVGAGLWYFNATFPKVPPAADVQVALTEDNIARGAYLANHVAVCIDCHSLRDWDKYAGPVVPGTEGAGGEAFTEEMGLPGKFYAKNITHTHLGDWSDGEIIRAVREGVNRDGVALFPIMPYTGYRHMRDADVQAIVAYLRTLDAKEDKVPERELGFPMSMIVKMIPQPAEPLPEGTTSVERGKYLTTIAGCADCHTPMEKGKPVLEKYLAGGNAYPLPSGMVYSANITPDKKTGIGNWDKETFILRFKAFADSSLQNMAVGEKDFNTVMPWVMYSGMTEQDLGDIYDYLKSIQPVNNSVERFVAK